MIPSEDKVRMMVRRAAKAVEAEPGVRVLNPDGMQRALKKGIEAAVETLHAIDSMSEEKIKSLSRRVSPGTREWEELFAKYVSEERRKRGFF